MPHQATFGRRASARPVRRTPVELAHNPAPAEACALCEHEETSETAPQPAPVIGEAPSVNDEIAQWNALRKIKKRSFRQPWKSFSIAAGLLFSVSFLLPDRVDDVVQIMLFVLFAVSIYAGLRKRTDQSTRAI